MSAESNSYGNLVCKESLTALENDKNSNLELKQLRKPGISIVLALSDQQLHLKREGDVYGHNTVKTKLTFHEEEKFIAILISTWWQKDLFPSEYLKHV